jgi:copper chaperone CopZ
MNRSIFLLAILMTLGNVAVAQQKKPVTSKIMTPGLKCEDCKMRVEDYLKFEDGIGKVIAYPKAHYVMVTYFTDRTNLENIKTAIANVGYDADDVTANEDSYKRLPTKCKKPEDGGHPKN